jgi:hypothetical protein
MRSPSFQFFQLSKAKEHHDKADYFRRRAAAVDSNRAIFSDDPDASEKLIDKLERLKKRQGLMKRANQLIRKADREGLAELGFADAAEDFVQLGKCRRPHNRLGFAYQVAFVRLFDRFPQQEKDLALIWNVNGIPSVSLRLIQCRQDAE